MQPKRKFSFVAKSALAGSLFLLTFSVSAKAGNRVVAWGDNSYGQTNVPPQATNVQAVAAGDTFSLVLKSDATVMAWGQGRGTNVPVGLSNVVAIAAGHGQSLALKNDGTLVAWGAPSTTATTNIPAGLSNIVAIACGDDHNLVLKSDGTIFAWGANYSGQTNISASLSNVVAIVAGNSSNLAIKRDGTAWASSSFASNQVSSLSNVVGGALVAGGFQGAAILGNGSARAWGYPNGTNVTIISNVTAAVGFSPFNQAGTVWLLQRNGTLTGLSGVSQTNRYLNLSFSNVLAFSIASHILAIVGDGFSQPIEPMLNVGFSAGQFTISQPTSPGRSYRLEYKNSLVDDWQMLPPIPGNSTTQTLADPNPPPAQRFYRVHVGQ